MTTLKCVMLLGIVGLSYAASSTSAPSFGGKTGKSGGWFNFWDAPVAGNSHNSGGLFTTPHPAGAAVHGAAAAAGGNSVQGGNSNTGGGGQGFFSWFANGASNTGNTGSSTSAPSADAAGGQVAPINGQGQSGQPGIQHGGGAQNSPHGGFNPDSSGEIHHVEMANPGMNMGGTYGNTAVQAGPGGSSGARGSGATGGNGVNGLPLNAHDFYGANAGRQVGSSTAASAIIGVGIALVVVVGVFAGVAIYLTRQRRNNHVMMASV